MPKATMMQSSENDPELERAIKRFVMPDRRYLRLLNGSFLRQRESAGALDFERNLASDARRIDDRDLIALLGYEWRARLTAAWLVALDQRWQYRERIGTLLLASGTVYSGQGFCFALARFETKADAELLVAYLDKYLLRHDLMYDQVWAMAALTYLDKQLSTSYAVRYFELSDIWGLWVRAFPHLHSSTLEYHQALVEQLITFADRIMDDR